LSICSFNHWLKKQNKLLPVFLRVFLWSISTAFEFAYLVVNWSILVAFFGQLIQPRVSINLFTSRQRLFKLSIALTVICFCTGTTLNYKVADYVIFLNDAQCFISLSIYSPVYSTMPVLEGKCADPKCNLEATSNKGDKQTITCASPFCKSQFHLHCVGLKGKKVSSLYFLCTACNDYINYSQAPINDRLDKLELQITNFTTKINEKITSLESEILLVKTNMHSKLQTASESIATNENNIEKFSADLKNMGETLTLKINRFEEKLKAFEIEKPQEINKEVANKCTDPTQEKIQINNTSHKNPTLKYQLRLSGVPEMSSDLSYVERQTSEHNYVLKVLDYLEKRNCKITDCYRLGKFNKDRKRPRSLLLTFSSVWDRNMVLQSAKSLSSFKDKIFLSPALSPAELEVEKKILRKRWQLLNEGVEKKNIKIRSLKLLVDGKEIDVNSD